MIKKQLLWIGCLESDEEFKIKAEKGYDLASAQVSQQNIVNGIEDITGEYFDSINGSVLPPYPVYAERDIDAVRWSHKKDCFDISVGYRNDKYINRVNCKNAMIKAADEWVKNRYKKGRLIVFVYSMRSAPMAAACRIKKRIPSAELYLIVTDLPQFMDLGESKLKKYLKKIDWIGIKQMQNSFDGFILYAASMAEYLKIPDEKWMLMEGSFDASSVQKPSIFRHGSKGIMYSGKLDSEYGIDMLVNAFMSINMPDIELWITGGGNAEEYIKKCAEKDKRIKFFGFLPKRSDVLDMQRKASLLVNMRLPSEPASEYCFPSKLFEYMSTGIPVLTFRLKGIPEEYYKYLNIIDEETEEAVADAVKAAVDDRKSGKGKAAREFILNNKNNRKQCERICSWVGL